jgi:predicted dehydrogenase
MSQINIAIVGLGFGAEFIPIYQRLKGVNMYAICQRTQSKLDEVGDKFGIAKRYTSYEDLLADPDVHAVHINSPIPDHGKQSIQALKAGKHVACTVPMATSLEECRQIIDLCKSTGLKYMMMETVVYAREFLFMKELYEKGELGKVQFLRATHQQDMEGWPGYWPGLPPMYYATHCVGPILGLMRRRRNMFRASAPAPSPRTCTPVTARPSPSRPATSRSRTAIYPRRWSARSSTSPASIASRSKSTARRNPSSGRSSSTIRWSSTPPRSPSRKSPRK